MDTVTMLQETLDNSKEKHESRNKSAVDYYERLKRLGIAKKVEYNIVTGLGCMHSGKDVDFLVR